MRKVIIFGIISFLGVLVLFFFSMKGKIFAQYSGGSGGGAASASITSGSSKATFSFGGRILHNKAIEIQTLESTNYKCIVPGTSITILPVGKSPTSFLIPAMIKSATNTKPASGQKILGLYSQTQTTITCIFQGKPPTTTTVQLTPITYFGTSKK